MSLVIVVSFPIRFLATPFSFVVIMETAYCSCSPFIDSIICNASIKLVKFSALPSKTGKSLDAVLIKSILDCAIVILLLSLFSIMLALASESVELSRSDIKTAGIVRLFISCSSILGFASVRSSDSIWSMSVCSVDSGASTVSTVREV